MRSPGSAQTGPSGSPEASNTSRRASWSERVRVVGPSLLIGEGSEDNLVRFHRNVTADGGEGTDTRNDIAADNEFDDAARFVASAFEVVLPPAV